MNFVYAVMVMNLGLSTYSFPWNIGIEGSLQDAPLTYKELIAFTCRNQIKHLQFGDNLPLHLLKDEEMHDLKMLAAACDIKIQAGTRRLTKVNIEQYIEIAAFFSSPFLRVVMDDVDYHPDIEEIIAVIKLLLPLLEQKNICLAIENHDRFKAKDLAHIIRQTNEKYVGICLDTANSLGAGEGIYEILPVLLPYTVNLHIKDFTIKRVDHKMGFTVSGTPAGEGMLDIPWLLQQCSRQQKCKTATLETWMNREEDMGQTIKKEKRWVQKSIHYLKKYIQ